MKISLKGYQEVGKIEIAEHLLKINLADEAKIIWQGSIAGSTNSFGFMASRRRLIEGCRNPLADYAQMDTLKWV
jgi:hypothetical protein